MKPAGSSVVRRSVLISLFAAVLYCPASDYLWHVMCVSPGNAQADGHPVYASGPVSKWTQPIAEHTWPYCFALSEALIGLALGIGLAMLWNRRRPDGIPAETRCRRCRGILRDLARPECPGCGESL